MLKIGVGIPTVNRKDLLMQAFPTYQRLYSNIPFFILDNGPQDLGEDWWYRLLTVGANIGVATSWNVLLTNIFNSGCDYALILNDDIVFDKSLEEISEFVEVNPAPLYGSKEHMFCAFLLHRNLFGYMKFDPMFYPCYWEDTDFLRRVKLAGVPYIQDDFFFPRIFRKSASIAKAPNLNLAYKNEFLYSMKWGGTLNHETWSIPFGRR
jgi:GT2 family glycosyltransferase